MSDLGARLKSWFGSEVDRAERDLATSRATTTRVRRRRPIPGLAIAGLLAAIVVVALAARPNVAPDAGKGLLRSPTSGVASPRSPDPSGAPVALGPDGIPTVLDGVRSLSVVEAIAHAQAATDDQPFVVGGWWMPSGERCAFNDRRVHPLLRLCGDASLRRSPGLDTDTLAIIPPDKPPYAGPIVVRVHTRDPRSATCPVGREERCRNAIIVDAIVWRPAVPVILSRTADGVPTDVAGEGTYRASHLGAFRLEPGAFLVAGWAAGGDPRPCPVIRLGPSIPVPPTQCWSSLLADERDGPAMLRPDISLPSGPLVLRVRLMPEATCPAGVECPATLPRVAVEEIVWAGDAVTDTNPLTIGDVYGALMSELEDIWVNVQPGSIRPGGCDPGFPASTWIAGGTQAVGYLLVFPTVTARETSGGNFRVDGYNGVGADGQVCRVTDVDGPASRWVAIDNVLVQVFSDDELPQRIEQGLESIAP